MDLLTEEILMVQWKKSNTTLGIYHGVMQYINGCGDRYAEKITAAMDYGTEEEVKKALCEYITECEYNHEICDYINSREWLK